MSKKKARVGLGEVKDALGVAKMVLDSVGIVPGGTLLPDLALGLIESYEAMKANNDSMSELLCSLKSLDEAIFRPIKAKKEQAEMENGRVAVPEDLAQRVKILNRAFDDTKAGLKQYSGLRGLARWYKRDDISSAINAANGNIARALEVFKMGGQVALELRIAEMALTATELSTLNRLECARGSDWGDRQGCLPDTRVKLLDELFRFANADTADPQDPHRVLLLTGVLGCGKSSVAHSLSERCHKANILGCCFIFKRGVLDTPNLLFSTIARRLADRPGLKEAIVSALTVKPESTLSADRDPSLAPFESQFCPLILDPLSKFAQSSRAHPLVLIIDALDEGCDESTSPKLVEILAEHCKRLPFKCRMVITLRYNDEIVGPLREQPHIRILEIKLADDDNVDDVAHFCRHSLATIAAKRRLGESWPGEDLTAKFIHKAEGLFIWASTTCAYLQRPICIDPTRQLEQLVEDHSSNVTSEAKMMELYASVLSAHPWDADFTRHYQLFVGTILASREPLSPVTLKSLLQLDMSARAIQEALRAFGPMFEGVGELQDGNQPVQILHDSYRIFSCRPIDTVSVNERGSYIDLAHHHALLALNVLRLLNRELPLLVKDGNTSPVSTRETISDGVLYGCRHLVDHITILEKPTEDVLFALQSFLGTNLNACIVICIAFFFPSDFVSSMLPWSQRVSFPLLIFINVSEYANPVLPRYVREITLSPELQEKFSSLISGLQAMINESPRTVELSEIQLVAPCLLFIVEHFQGVLRHRQSLMDDSTAAEVLNTLGNFVVAILEPLVANDREHKAMSEAAIQQINSLNSVLIRQAISIEEFSGQHRVLLFGHNMFTRRRRMFADIWVELINVMDDVRPFHVNQRESQRFVHPTPT